MRSQRGVTAAFELSVCCRTAVAACFEASVSSRKRVAAVFAAIKQWEVGMKQYIPQTLRERTMLPHSYRIFAAYRKMRLQVM